MFCFILKLKHLVLYYFDYHSITLKHVLHIFLLVVNSVAYIRRFEIKVSIKSFEMYMLSFIFHPLGTVQMFETVSMCLDFFKLFK